MKHHQFRHPNSSSRGSGLVRVPPGPISTTKQQKPVELFSALQPCLCVAGDGSASSSTVVAKTPAVWSPDHSRLH